jgi:membrane protease YdiL (CAAX protease family)
MDAGRNEGVARLIRRHPLPAFFVLAYVGAWLFIAPILLSQMALKVLEIPDALLLGLFIGATYAGPLPAALIVTSLTDGRAGVKSLLRRIVQWRGGLRWYLVVLLGYPAVYVAGYSFMLGVEPLQALLQTWPLLLTSYLPLVLFGILWPGLGEEPGWRGFALPRLQRQYGPLAGSLILGTLHAFWHFPVYFVPGLILPGAFDLTAFIANSLAIVVMTIVWTWIFNNTRGSVWMAMLTHGASNANSMTFPGLMAVSGLAALPDDQWATLKFFGVCALLIIIATRGRLSYKREDAKVITPK